MIEEIYAEMVSQRAKPGSAILKSLDAKKCHLLHMAIGISGEAGELLDAVKKHIIYERDLDVENVIEELGDLEFYIQGLREALSLKRDHILMENVKKLDVRYLEGYTDKEASLRRDKQ